MERGIEGSRWHHLCCVVFYQWQSSKEGRGLPTRSRDKQAYVTGSGTRQKFNLRFCVASLLNSSSSTTRNHKDD